MVVFILFAVSTLAAIASNLMLPKSPKLRTFIQILSIGGVTWFLISMGLFAYGFSLADEKTVPPFLAFLDSLSMVIVAGMFIAPICTIVAWLVAMGAKAKGL